MSGPAIPNPSRQGTRTLFPCQTMNHEEIPSMSPRKKQEKIITEPLPSIPPFLPGTFPQEEPHIDHVIQHRAAPLPHAHEQFDINLITAAGTIGSVWGKHGDVFARLTLSTRGRLIENEPRHTAHVTLRFAQGMIATTPVSIMQGDLMRVQGYLVHREYQETLRRFLDEAHALHFLDCVHPSDLPAWRELTLTRRNGLVNVRCMSMLRADGTALEVLGEPAPIPSSSNNHVLLEGIVARVWEYRHNEETDLFARLAVYDEHTPIDSKRTGNFGRARRMAHYATIRFENGSLPSGGTVRLREKMRVRISGQLRDLAQVVTLRDELLKTGSPAVAAMMQRVTDPSQLSEILNQQESLHVLADAIVIYSSPANK